MMKDNHTKNLMEILHNLELVDKLSLNLKNNAITD